MKSIIVAIASIIYSPQPALGGKVVLFNKGIGLNFLPLASATLGRTSYSHLRLLTEDTEDLCSIETEALQNDSSFVSASTQMESCPSQEIVLVSSVMNMNVDFSTCSYADEYEIACTNAGGKVDKLESMNIQCLAQYNGQTMTISASQSNVPLCVGQSCTGSVDDKMELSLFQQVAANTIQSALSAVGISADCEVGSASSVILNRLVVVGGLVVLLSNTH